MIALRATASDTMKEMWRTNNGTSFPITNPQTTRKPSLGNFSREIEAYDEKLSKPHLNIKPI